MYVRDTWFKSCNVVKVHIAVSGFWRLAVRSVVTNIPEMHRHGIPIFTAENRGSNWKHCCQQRHNAEYKIRIVLKTIYFIGMQNNLSKIQFCNPAGH